jgi:hypothetical protein
MKTMFHKTKSEAMFVTDLAVVRKETETQVVLHKTSSLKNVMLSALVERKSISTKNFFRKKFKDERVKTKPVEEASAELYEVVVKKSRNEEVGHGRRKSGTALSHSLKSLFAKKSSEKEGDDDKGKVSTKVTLLALEDSARTAETADFQDDCTDSKDDHESVTDTHFTVTPERPILLEYVDEGFGVALQMKEEAVDDDDLEAFTEDGYATVPSPPIIPRDALLCNSFEETPPVQELEGVDSVHDKGENEDGTVQAFVDHDEEYWSAGELMMESDEESEADAVDAFVDDEEHQSAAELMMESDPSVLMVEPAMEEEDEEDTEDAEEAEYAEEAEEVEMLREDIECSVAVEGSEDETFVKKVRFDVMEKTQELEMEDDDIPKNEVIEASAVGRAFPKVPVLAVIAGVIILAAFKSGSFEMHAFDTSALEMHTVGMSAIEMPSMNFTGFSFPSLDFSRTRELTTVDGDYSANFFNNAQVEIEGAVALVSGHFVKTEEVIEGAVRPASRMLQGACMGRGSYCAFV